MRGRASEDARHTGGDDVSVDLFPELEWEDVGDVGADAAIDVTEADAEVVEELQPVIVGGQRRELRGERDGPLGGADAHISVKLHLLRAEVARS